VLLFVQTVPKSRVVVAKAIVFARKCH
jgi:hypothetical protein